MVLWKSLIHKNPVGNSTISCQWRRSGDILLTLEIIIHGQGASPFGGVSAPNDLSLLLGGGSEDQVLRIGVWEEGGLSAVGEAVYRAIFDGGSVGAVRVAVEDSIRGLSSVAVGSPDDSFKGVTVGVTVGSANHNVWTLRSKFD